MIPSTVYNTVRGYNATHQKGTTSFVKAEGRVSPTLTLKLLSYAHRRFRAAGLFSTIRNCTVSVSAYQTGETPVTERHYEVAFTNPEGTCLSLDYILLNKHQTPVLDSGLSIYE